MSLTYGSVCSGIEAATVAWRPLGWKAAFVSEIEAFPRAVLAHHYPETPLHGDFTTIQAGEYDPIDLLVGGTPCQSFSVAGLRGGLSDSRGNLTLEYLRLAERLRPRWLVWENVPGVFSSLSHDAPDPREPEDDLDGDNGPADGEEVVVEDGYDADESHAFACLLAGLSELGYGFAYRVLDAQYAGVPQRRRRVFVVGYLGDWRRAAAVLLERHSLSGDSPPSREARQDVAVSPALRAQSNSSHRADSQAFVADVAGALLANGKAAGSATNQDADQGLLVAFQATGNSFWREGVGPLASSDDNGTNQMVVHALRGEGFDASEDGTGRGTPLVPVAYRTAGDGAVYEEGDRTAPLTTCTDSSASIVAWGITRDAIDRSGDAAADDAAGRSGLGITEGLAQTIKAKGPGAVAFALRGRDGGAMPEVEGEGDQIGALRAASGGSTRDYVAFAENQRNEVRELEVAGALGTTRRGDAKNETLLGGSAVRRLTPRECERLQGFPDDYTAIPYRGGVAADGPRYKALGNSMAVPVMAWIGQRIAAVEAMAPANEAAA